MEKARGWDTGEVRWARVGDAGWGRVWEAPDDPGQELAFILSALGSHCGF